MLNNIKSHAAAYLGITAERIGEATVLNAVYAIAREYLLFVTSASLTAKQNKIYLNALGKRFLRLKAVFNQSGRRVRAEIFSNYIRLPEDGKYTLEYYYEPDTIPYGRLTDNLLGLAAAAEYALSNGLYEKAMLLRDRLRDAMQTVTRDVNRCRLPARRWHT